MIAAAAYRLLLILGWEWRPAPPPAITTPEPYQPRHTKQTRTAHTAALNAWEHEAQTYAGTPYSSAWRINIPRRPGVTAATELAKLEAMRLELRAAGATYQEIANQFHITKPRAIELTRKALENGNRHHRTADPH